MPGKKKKDQTAVWVFVFWLLIAIIGAGILFTGIENSLLSGNIRVSITSVMVGIILIFIGLIMVIGKANLDAGNVEMPQKKPTENKEKDTSKKEA